MVGRQLMARAAHLGQAGSMMALLMVIIATLVVAAGREFIVSNNKFYCTTGSLGLAAHDLMMLDPVVQFGINLDG